MTDTTSPTATSPTSDDVRPAGAGTAGDEHTRRRFGRELLLTAAVLVGAAVVAMACAIALGSAGLDRTSLAMVVGGLAGAALAFTAVTRFVTFLLVLIVLRGTLDGLKLTGVGGSAITEPGVMVGGVLLIACVLWLLAQRSAGLIVSPSRTAKWMLALAGAGMLGVLPAGNRAAAAEAAIRVVTSVLTFVVFEQLLARRPVLIRGMLAATMASLVGPAIVGLQQLSAGSDFEATDLDRIRGTFVHPNALASYAVTLALVAFAVAQVRNGRLRVAAWTVFAVASTLLFFTYGRAAWAGILVGLGYLLWHVRPQLVLVLVAAIVAAPLVIPSIGQRLSDLGGEEPTPQEIGDGNANSFAWRTEYWGRSPRCGPRTR